MTIPHNLISATRSGEVVPLIGSGISQASGMASWDDLLAILKKFMDATGDSTSELDALDTPDVFVGKSGKRQDLMSFLNESFGHGFKPNELHELLSKIPCRTILTTNWDTLLEDSLRNSGKKVNIIFDDESARNWRESQATQVIKFHGTIQTPKSIVIGLNDYSKLYHQPSILMSLVRTIMATRPILFLGFGMKDPFVKSLFNALNDSASPEHYVVISDKERNRKQQLENMNLSVIETEGSSTDPFGLNNFLTELWKQTYTEAKGRHERTSLLIRETKRLENHLGADKHLRVRASMGPLAVPETNDIDVYGGEGIYAIEKLLLETVLAALQNKQRKIRLICCPLDGGQHSIRKGYSPEAHKARLRAFVKWVNQLGSQVEIVMTPRPSDINDWIVSTLSIIESRKSQSKEGRLYQYARLDVNTNYVSSSVIRFDEEFENIAAQNGGVEECKRIFLELAQKEIDN